MSFVTEDERQVIADRSAAAGLSISAYLRRAALARAADEAHRNVLRPIDEGKEQLDHELHTALADLSATLGRLSRAESENA